MNIHNAYSEYATKAGSLLSNVKFYLLKCFRLSWFVLPIDNLPLLATRFMYPLKPSEISACIACLKLDLCAVLAHHLSLK